VSAPACDPRASAPPAARRATISERALRGRAPSRHQRTQVYLSQEERYAAAYRRDTRGLRYISISERALRGRAPPRHQRRTQVYLSLKERCAAAHPRDTGGHRYLSQSTELTRGPPGLVHPFRLYGELTSAQDHCMSCYGFGNIFHLSQCFLPSVLTCRRRGEG
jgi:hypothetical protein